MRISKEQNKAHTQRMMKNIAIATIAIAISLFMGMIGYKYYCQISWADALLNASMILTGMGPVDNPKTDAGKIFSGLYALYSGIVFLTTVALMIAPVFHRYFHKINLEMDDDE